MALGGEKRQESLKKVGIGLFNVIAINPTKEELEGIYGVEIEKEPVYLSEKDGIAHMDVDFFLEEVNTKTIIKYRVFLDDKIVMDKTKTKTQYLNQLGRQQWVDDESNLNEKFTAYPYHKARAGEAELIAFLDAWMDIDRKKPYNLEVNWTRLMAGNVSELTDVLKSDLTREVVGCATVRIVDKDGEVNEYQGIYRKFLPGYTFKYFNTAVLDEDKINSLRNQKATQKETKKYLKNYESFVVDITDRENGCKDIYTLSPIRDYVKGETLVATNDVIQEDDLGY